MTGRRGEKEWARPRPVCFGVGRRMGDVWRMMGVAASHALKDGLTWFNPKAYT